MRLEITRKTNLAIRVLATLRDAESRMGGKELASRIGTSTTFLAQVVTPLARHGWITSQPGRAGGYELAAEAKDLSVLDVIEAVEGPTDTQSCVLREGECSATDPCATHEAWSRAVTALVNELAATPVSIVSSQGGVR